MARPLRILYSAGPGDVIATYRHWALGEDDPTQLSMTYSGMFYELCREGGHQAYVISSCARPDSVRDGAFQIVHRKTPFETGPGPLFYVGQEWASLRLIASALWFKADVAVIACGTASWITLRLLPWLGVAVVPSLHCVLWPPHRPPTPLQRIMRRLRKGFFRRTAFRILSASQDITDQVLTMTGGKHRPIKQFLPTYRRQQFAALNPPTIGDEFRVLYAGRIEENKGVADLLHLARQFAQGDAAGRSIAFDLCGDGSFLKPLREKIAAAGLGDRFRCHGHCGRAEMRQRFADAHVVIVPTTGDFVEGFNQVVAEAVLANRPVITSEVCPALQYVRDAVVEVPVDDVAAYGNAIVRLQSDRALYEKKQAACAEVAEQFYDLRRSWMVAVQETLGELTDCPVSVQEMLPETVGSAS